MTTLNVGIRINAFAAGALSTLNNLTGSLQNFGKRATGFGTSGFSAFRNAGMEATQAVSNGFAEAERSWFKLGGALGVPFSMAGIWSAVSGINSIKTAIIDANAEMETNRTRMTSLIRDYDDTKGEAEKKSLGLTNWVEKFATDTYFDPMQLTEATVIGASMSKDPATVRKFVETASKVAALKGTKQVDWAAQAVQSAMNGDTTSLKESFNINASKELVESMAYRTRYGNTANGRFEAIMQLVNQRAGKGMDIVYDQAKTGSGAQAVLQGTFQTLFRKVSEGGYKEGVKALISLNDRMAKWQESPGFNQLFKFVSDRYASAVKTMVDTMDRLLDSADQLPKLYQRYAPLVKQFMHWGSVIGGVYLGTLALKGAMGMLLTVATTLGRILAPTVMLMTNPVLTGGLILLGSLMYPLAKGFQVGGKSIDQWLVSTAKLSEKRDWQAVFTKPLVALQGLIKGLGNGSFNVVDFWKNIIAPESLLGRLGAIVKPVIRGLRDALVDTFPGLKGVLDDLQHHLIMTGYNIKIFGWEVIGLYLKAKPALEGFFGFIGDHLPLILSLGGGFLALNGAMRVLGTIGTALSPALTALRGVGAALMPLANPAVAGVLAGLGLLLYPLVRDLKVGEKSIDQWMVKLGDMSAKVDWKGIFLKPIEGIKNLFSNLKGGKFDAYQFWQELFAPNSLLARIKDIVKPILDGLMQALDAAFPQFDGWFQKTFASGFDKVGKALKSIGDVLIPLASGAWDGAKPILEALMNIAVAFGKVAWTAISKTFEALGRFAATPDGKNTLESIGKAIGLLGSVALVAGIGMKGNAALTAKAAQTFMPGLTSFFGATPITNGAAWQKMMQGAMQAGKWMLTLPAATIAALTLTAAAVYMTTKELHDNLRTDSVFMPVSRHAATDGKYNADLFKSVLGNQLAKDQQGRQEQAGVLGMLGFLSGRGESLASMFRDKTGLKGSAAKDFNLTVNSSGMVYNAMNAGLQRLLDKKSRGELDGKESADLLAKVTAMSIARQRISQMLSTEDLSKVDQKALRTQYDRFMRNGVALMQSGWVDNVIPKDLIKGSVWNGWSALVTGNWSAVGRGGQMDNFMNAGDWTGDSAPDDGGGAPIPVVVVDDGGGAALGRGPAVHVTAPVTIYSTGAEPLTESRLQAFLDARVREMVSQEMAKALGRAR
ncbi:hypothetical protein [Deinococcus kurensis]|uniref:hypothetical protein n=1 Tax=Deinococcus kurensis TaxID=2662757 RepID=UPI0012D345CB|nr:hypothetical protein [Deinococcus kurensis]